MRFCWNFEYNRWSIWNGFDERPRFWEDHVIKAWFARAPRRSEIQQECEKKGCEAVLVPTVEDRQWQSPQQWPPQHRAKARQVLKLSLQQHQALIKWSSSQAASSGSRTKTSWEENLVGSLSWCLSLTGGPSKVQGWPNYVNLDQAISLTFTTWRKCAK